MTHAHHWRATSKVFARVCACGTAYHDWLLLENEWLLTEVDRLKAVPAGTDSTEELNALRAQLEAALLEGTALRSELDVARRELEANSKRVSSIDPACTGSLVHSEFTLCPVHR